MFTIRFTSAGNQRRLQNRMICYWQRRYWFRSHGNASMAHLSERKFESQL